MIQGAWKLLSGLRLLLSTRQLRAVLWRMLGLLLLLTFALMLGVFELADYVAHLWLPEGDAWYWLVLSWLVWVMAFFLAILTGVVSFTALGSAAVAPWLDTLAARTEALHGASSQESNLPWWQLCLASLSNSVRPLLGLLLWGVLALLLFLIPVIGQVLGACVWAYAGIRFLCFELIDTMASRKNMSFAQRKELLNQRRWYWLSFGGAAMLMMMVPVLNLLVIPAAVVALSCADQ